MLSRTLARVSAAVPSGMKYPLAGWRPLYNFFLRLGQSTVTIHTTGGLLHWRLDDLTSQEILLGTYEMYMQRAFQRFILPGFTVYDIGAHTGFHSLLCGLLVGPAGSIIAFEPNPTSYHSFQLQLTANPHLPILLYSYALSDRCTQLKLNTVGDSRESAVDVNGNLAIEARTIDSLVESGTLSPPDLIKMDVEGHEEEVLKGAQKVLVSHRPIILCDLNDNSTLQKVTSVLDTIGYDVDIGPPITAVHSNNFQAVTGQLQREQAFQSDQLL
jgi:FkbM family methyltransferase